MSGELILAIAALGVAVLSAGIAIWQGRLSASQLKLAQDTEGRTEKALDEIKRVSSETRQIVQDVKNNIDERITKILDSKLAAEAGSQAVTDQVTSMFMTEIMKGLGGAGGPGTAGKP